MKRRKLRLLDLYCGAGGCAQGYHAAGFDRIVGIDILPQRNYPFKFYQRDVLDLDVDWIADNFDAVHASPPCQAWTQMRALSPYKYPKLIKATRKLLRASGLPYVIENVVNAPLRNPVMLCGSSFGMRIQRHRLFEVNFPLVAPPCDHAWQTPVFPIHTRQRNRNRNYYFTGVLPVYGGGTHVIGTGGAQLARDVMEMEWTTARHEVTEAVPPAYTEYIGGRLRRHILDDALTAEWVRRSNEIRLQN